MQGVIYFSLVSLLGGISKSINDILFGFKNKSLTFPIGRQIAWLPRVN